MASGCRVQAVTRKPPLATVVSSSIDFAAGAGYSGGFMNGRHNQPVDCVGAPGPGLLRCGGRRPSLLSALLPLLLIVPILSHGQGTPRELREQANLKLARGEFMDAIPDLQQLIEWLGDSETPRIQASMEMVYYQLGLAQFFIGQFDAAEDGLTMYLKKYRHGAKRMAAALYIADAQRFKGKTAVALSSYRAILRQYSYPIDMKADIYSSIARCHLSEDKWSEAIDPLKEVYRISPDFLRLNWAATLLITAYFKELDLDKVYPLVPYVLHPDSFASRSVAFNLAAMEAGEDLFGTERYRDALWVFRMVFPHDEVIAKGEAYLAWLKKRAAFLRTRLTDPRLLMRLQENIGEMEAEISAMSQIENYNQDLTVRIARGYMEMLRYWEARDMFVHLHAMADEPDAEEALSLAFQCSMQIIPWDRAYAIGDQYMSEYPSGDYFDYITLAMGQMHAREKNWPEVIRHLTKTLEMRPEHESAASCMFLIGYASFMEEKFEDAVTWLKRVTEKFPQTELLGEVTYWMAMAYMFDNDYESASTQFDRVLEHHASSVFAEDAAFRRAVCDYGLSRYEESEQRLAAFLDHYPQSRLASEASMMRGDIGGALGNVMEAVVHYQTAMKDPEVNIEFYNHSAFQTGTLLTDEGRLDDVISHFKAYVKEKREGCNIAQAAYWIGVSLWNQGEQARALRYYRQAVELYGEDPATIGIDMILDEWMGRIKRSTKEDAQTAWLQLRTALDEAIAAKKETLVLRLKRIMLYGENVTSTEKQRIENEFLSEANIAPASPAVLQKMLELAQARKRNDLAVKVARHIIARYTETDYALDARMVLARMAIEAARTVENPREREQRYAEAIVHLGVIREVFASSGEAGEALLLLGQLYTEQRQYEEADACYKSVLGVKGWRNLWPEAIYGRGDCAYARRQYDVASAYYERIYLMYAHYRQWTAKAYLKRAESLRKLYQDQKAVEVLDEMLKIPGIDEFPETVEARVLVRKLRGEA